MSKKAVTLQLNKQQIDDKISIESKEDEAESNTRLLTAEEVTNMATDLLEGLGYKKAKPIKVVQEGMRYYVVEVNLKQKNATIVIDANAKEIKEYEINDVSKKSAPSSIPILKIIPIMCGIQVLLMVLFNFLRDYIPFL